MANSIVYPNNVLIKVHQTANTVWPAGAVTRATFTENVGIDGYYPVAAVLDDDNPDTVFNNLIVNITPFFVSVRSMSGSNITATIKIKFIFVPFDNVGIVT